MEVVLPPAITACSASCEGSSRVWHVPDGIFEAEQKFHTLLPSLLDSNEGKWVYMTSNGRHEFAETQDEAGIAAIESGIPRDEFVVRFISLFDLDSI
jgi:hypothetical protein